MPCRMLPSTLCQAKFAECVSPGAYRFRGNQKDEEVGAPDFLGNTIVVFQPWGQIFAIEKDVVPLCHEREVDAIGHVTIRFSIGSTLALN